MLISIPTIPNKKCPIMNPAIIVITNNADPKMNEIIITSKFALSNSMRKLLEFLCNHFL